MRRLHCLAILVAFLCIVSLAWARVASTPAYAARSGFGKLRPGMTRSEVRRCMADHEGIAQTEASDGWHIGDDYWLRVEYERPATCAEPVLKAKWLSTFRRNDAADKILDLLGFPEAQVISFG
jgi:hypothetical protein